MKRLSLIVVAITFVAPAWAYKESTHEDMSEAAAFSSVLAKPETLSTLGLSGGIDDPQLTFPNSEGKEKTIKFLIRDGARFEDSGSRSLNHFYDPLHDRGLFGVNVAFPDWALEDARNINRQKFSYKDARDDLYKALTLQSRQERKKNFGLTFQTLGQVIHHVQDMAQPQHVRNDAHCDAIFPCLIPGGLLGLYNPSLYENYTKDLGGNLPFTGYPPVTFDTARKFWTGQDQGIADFTNQNFLSAGTNFDAGKSATLPTPLRAKDYPKPEWNRQTQTRTWAELLAEEGISCNPNPLPGGGGGCGIECTGLPPQNAPPACLLSGEMDFYATNVVDHYNPAASGNNPRASTLSIFDQDLVNTGKRQFALNRFNFQAAYPFLIPKAVAYSAGLIDYFFRGRLEVNDVSDDDTQLFIEVKNVSGVKNDFSRGRFEVYYDAVDGTRKPLMVTQNVTTNLAVDGRVELTATKPKLSDVDLSKDNPLTLVYRGQIGAEEGIATSVLEMPLSGFVVSPSPLAAGNPGNHVYFEDGTWRVSPYAGLAAGNIDWKGSINGHTKVLSWLGSKGRNLPDWTDFQYGAKPQPSPYIFQNGRVLAVAPAPVLGAALTRDSQGDIWLVAIVYDDIVYRRPAKRLASALLDPNNPTTDWTEVGRFPRDKNFGSPDRPWFFNASGTQAQTMRLASKTLTQVLNGVASQAQSVGLDRLSIELQDGRVVSTQNRGNLAGYHTSMQCQVMTLGKDEYATQSTSSSTGEYVIGVDYQGDQEMLAKISYEASEQSDSLHGVNSNSHTSSTESEMLTVGSQTYKLVEDSNIDTQDQPQGQPYQEQIQHHGKSLYLYSMNMRDDLLAYYSGTVDDNTLIQSTNIYGFYSIALNSQVEDVDHVRFEGTDREAFRNAQSFTGVYKLYSGILGIRGCPTGILGVPLYSTETMSLPISPTRGFAYNPMKGAWSVDTAGRLFVSQTKGSLQYLVPSDTFYNFLSGGIPDSLISPPADKQNFVPVGLIR